MSSTEFHSREPVERSIEDHTGQEERGLQRIPDNVAKVAPSSQRAVANNVVGATGMHEYHHSKLLDLGPERIVFRRRRYLASGVTRDSDTPQSQFLYRRIQLLGGQIGMLQGDRRQTDKPVGMSRTPLRELLILDVDNPAGEVAVWVIPPASLMRQNLNIDTGFIQHAQTLGSEDQRAQ